jgi:hypothetical protein
MELAWLFQRATARHSTGLRQPETPSHFFSLSQRGDTMKRILIAVVLVVGLIGLVGAVQQNPRDVTYGKVKAQEFVLTDSKGKMQGYMGSGFDGNPFMRMIAKNGAYAQMSAHDKGTEILLTDAKKVSRLQMVVQPGGAGITLSDANKKRRLELIVFPNGSSVVSFRNAADKIVHKISVDENGNRF